MRFRPCIDLHQGVVKQIVGSTLTDRGSTTPVTNFIATRSPAYYAGLYRRDGLEGGHVIMLGPGNQAAAREALAAYPGGLQIGGGVTSQNAAGWLDAGAAKVIMTSYIFRAGRVRWDRLERVAGRIGPHRLVLDLSCKSRDGEYFVMTDRWQTFTQLKISKRGLARLARYCSEFLVHAVDVEGKQAGVDSDLIVRLAECSPVSTTYAGGVRELADLQRVDELSGGKLDVTVGSALDIFGGTLAYRDVVALDRKARREP